MKAPNLNNVKNDAAYCFSDTASTQFNFLDKSDGKMSPRSNGKSSTGKF